MIETRTDKKKKKKKTKKRNATRGIDAYRVGGYLLLDDAREDRGQGLGRHFVDRGGVELQELEQLDLEPGARGLVVQVVGAAAAHGVGGGPFVLGVPNL